MNESFFGKIIQFLQNNYKNWLKSENDLPKIMPLAIMMLGANTPDHDETFTFLCDKIKETSNNFTVRLKSRDCGSLKKVMECIIKSIIPSTNLAEMNLPNSLKNSLVALDEWLKNKKMDVSKQIILIVEDVELFNTEILQNLIEITSSRNSRHPFILLMGLSSNLESLDGFLTNRSLMSVSKHFFYSTSPSDLLNLFLSHLMSEGFPFQLSGRLFSYIINDMFMCLDYSISHLIQRYQFCLHEHIMNSSNLDNILNIEANDYNELCTLNPLIMYTKKYQKLVVQISRWLLDLFSKFSDSKLGTRFHQVLTIHLKYGLGFSEHLKSNLEILKSLSTEEVVSLIHFANSNLSNEKENCSIISDFIENSTKFASEMTVDESLTDKIPLNIPTSRKNLKEQIFRNASIKKKPFLQDFSNWLHKWLNENLPHYSKFTGHEVLFIDCLDTFKLNINPSIRETLKKGLLDPYAFFNDKTLATNSLKSTSENLPDTCVLYKLLIDFPRIIYLYDWLQAFDKITERKDSDIDSPPTKMIQCRFNKGVTELEVLGFVKRVKSKVDVMNNLTWCSLF